ncbi:MAG: hypothetical protein IKN00_04165 [Bacteroidales bacterium]|nr:hypothetical protein [Bacteroidales bacterium]
METKASRAALEAALGIYDAIPGADRVCRPCQSSDFRGRVVAKAAVAAAHTEALRAAVETPAKKGVPLDAERLKKAVEFLDGVRKAETAYEYDARGDTAFRNWCLGAHKAANVAAAFGEIRRALEAPEKTPKKTAADDMPENGPETAL